jgi:S1-C subfamily serine protease/regulator of sirC expression with transglutaminase-like and TPR domain
MKLLSLIAIALLPVPTWDQTTVQTPSRREANTTLSPQEVFSRVSPSVFVVESLNSRGEVFAYGSGVAVRIPRKSNAASDLLVVTNKHVIYGAVAYRVRKGEKAWKATLVRLDQGHDLCALQPEAGWTAKPIPVRVSSTVKVGERTYAIGAPEGLELTLSEGLVSGLRDIDSIRVIQTSAPISHGSSGGGLFDSEGRLIGVTTFFLKEGQNLNFALPGEWVLALGEESAAHFSASAAGSQLEEAKELSDKGFRAYLDGRYQDAADAYGEVVRLDPSDHTAWYRLGEAQEELNRDEKALNSFERSTELDKNDPLPWRSMVHVYLRLHRFAEAINPANQVVRLQGDSPAAWAELGMAYLGAKNYKKAVDTCEIWTSLEPDNSKAWALLGIAQSRSNQLNDAEASLKLAISLTPGDTGSLYQLGLVYSRQGNQRMVREVYEALRRLDSNLAEKLVSKAAPH